jgi:hypothetical protein
MVRYGGVIADDEDEAIQQICNDFRLWLGTSQASRVGIGWYPVNWMIFVNFIWFRLHEFIPKESERCYMKAI